MILYVYFVFCKHKTAYEMRISDSSSDVCSSDLKKNALTADMYRAMTAALADASARDEIGAVLFAGKGDAFCAGNDLNDFMSGPQGGEAAFAFIRAIANFGKPAVATVQGLAVGVGTTMLFHCDLVYAAPDARFTMPFVNLGIVPRAEENTSELQ